MHRKGKRTRYHPWMAYIQFTIFFSKVGLVPQIIVMPSGPNIASEQDLDNLQYKTSVLQVNSQESLTLHTLINSINTPKNINLAYPSLAKSYHLPTQPTLYNKKAYSQEAHLSIKHRTPATGRPKSTKWT